MNLKNKSLKIMNLNAQRPSKACIKFDIEASRVESSDSKRKGSLKEIVIWSDLYRNIQL